MNQLFLVVLALLIILQSVFGAPVVPCHKLKDSKLSPNNIYFIALKENHTEEDANGIADTVDKYQSSLEKMELKIPSHTLKVNWFIWNMYVY